MDQWKEFESWYERCNNWLKDVEVKVKDTELKATLKDKQNQLDKLKRLQDDLGARQGDIDALSDAAQDLVKISTDTRVVSQASQLGTKYQTLRVNIKVSQVSNSKLQNIPSQFFTSSRQTSRYIVKCFRAGYRFGW